ncbi:phosphatidate phosphatase-like protein [Sarcoptes scabiei]|uniref:Phosphatidate phosphatase-like protein n=2 Tax=Sarcoptes scabiei TaxID=52283 RepID=A0A132A602_SARSC|nr:phosphatidate phosphatase-like protein [Sarcoptes scabiei]
MLPNRKQLIIRLIIDSFVLLTISIPILLFYQIGQPYKRGFNCNDDSIRYPFLASTISSNLLFTYSSLIPIITFCITEYLLLRRLTLDQELSRRIWWRYYVWRIYLTLVPFAFACLTSQLITDIAKYSIGRLRPHFIDVCRPRVNGEIIDRFSHCKLSPEEYITEFECTRNDLSARYQIKDSRLSFMSGHSSFSAVALMYAVIYIQLRFSWRQIGLFKPLLQYLLICLTLFTGFSRISDYKHHWSDVLIGLIQGTLVAIICVCFVSDLFEQRNFYNKLKPSRKVINRSNKERNDSEL